MCNICHRDHQDGTLCAAHQFLLPDQANEHQEAIEEHDRIKEITDARGAVYGHPADHFKRTTGMLNALGIGTGLGALDWAFIMICDKLARLRESPEHRDSWEDIAGYARTALMILERRGL